MSTVTIRQASLADAYSLAPRLRPADRAELSLSSGPDIAATIMESLLLSHESFAAEEGGLVIALWGFGMSDAHPTVGVPWFVASPEATRHPLKIVSIGRECVARWGTQCAVLSNFTHAENHMHHRWLRHIGFQFAPDPVPMGDSGEPFLQFYRHSGHV